MTFTYSGTLATDLDEIRFKIGDTVSGSGLKPGGTNYTDEEIAGLLAIEGTVGRTTAAIYENLALLWANKGLSEIGPRKEDYKGISQQFAKLAEQAREDYGSATSTVSFGFVTRVDGYSNDIDSGETSDESA